MSRTLKVLIVEDSADDTELVLRALRRDGFAPEAERVQTAEALRAALTSRQWDLVIADYSLPQLNGLEALTLVQEAGRDIPFILVSGTIGEETAVAAVKAGAHDYLMKGNLTRLGTAVARELREAALRVEHRQAREDLARRSRELERNFEMTLGREDRVVELKREINELLQLLGKTLKYNV